MTLAQNSSRHLEIASYYEELYYSAVLTSCLAATPLVCMNNYGKFFGFLSVIVHFQSSTLNLGFLLSSPPSSSAGGYSYSSSSPSPSPLFLG
jgi:hypothetical protein